MTIARWFIGLASGSGGEGTDAVLVETTGIGLQLTSRVIQVLHRSHPRDVRELFLKTLLSGGSTSLGDLASLHRHLGESAAAAVTQLVTPMRLEAHRILAVGHIGPLAWHEPSGRNPASFEIGQSSAIAERTGLTVLSEFRERDLAAGGQGMPITALADWILFRNPQQARSLLHLGGTTSLVHIPAQAKPQDVFAFEVGPGTRLLDAVIRQGSAGREHFDAGGKHAAFKRADVGAVNVTMRQFFLRQTMSPPVLPQIKGKYLSYFHERESMALQSISPRSILDKSISREGSIVHDRDWEQAAD